MNFNALDEQDLHMNGITPDRMTPSERLAELGRILTAGLIRMKAGKSSPLSPNTGESSVDYAPPKSGHATRNSRSTTR